MPTSTCSASSGVYTGHSALLTCAQGAYLDMGVQVLSGAEPQLNGYWRAGGGRGREKGLDGLDYHTLGRAFLLPPHAPVPEKALCVGSM